jgi:SHS family lactate transporter-like MFS transporter
MPAIMQEFGVSRTATALVTTLTLLVRLLGGCLAGVAADRWGRKLPLLFSIVWFAVCDGAVALAPTFTAVVVLRVLFGLEMGAEWTAGTTLAMESWPKRSRGIASGILQAGWPVGYLLASLAAATVIPVWGWRTLFLLAALPALLVLPLRTMVPDDVAARERSAADRTSSSGSLAELWGPEVRSRLLWACGPMGLGFAAYYALTGLYSVLLVQELKVGPGVMGSTSALFFLGMLLGVVGSGVLAHHRGVQAAIVFPALLTVPALPLYVGARPELLGPGAFLVGALGVGWSGVTAHFLTGLFPARIRGRAVGVVYHVGALIGAVAMTIPALLSDSLGLSLQWSIGLTGGVCELLLALWLLMAPPESAGETAASFVPEPVPAMVEAA